MTRIKLTRDAGGRTAGDTIDVTPSAAEHLIHAGYADTVAAPPTEAKKARRKTPENGVGGAPPSHSSPTAG